MESCRNRVTLHCMPVLSCVIFVSPEFIERPVDLWAILVRVPSGAHNYGKVGTNVFKLRL